MSRTATDVKWSDLLKRVAIKSGMPYTHVKRHSNAIMQAILNELAQGNSVQVAGFGTFWLQIVRSPKGFDYYTQSVKQREDYYSIKFRTSQPIRKRIRDAQRAKSKLQEGRVA